MSRVAIYARVSTEDRGQDPENQLAQLRAWCGAAGHEIVAEYVEHASGGKDASKRPRFAAMLADAHRRQFDVVLCWALDRLSREGMMPTIGDLQRLAAAGVAFHSYSEPMLSTDNEMVRDIVLAVMPRWRRLSGSVSASAQGRAGSGPGQGDAARAPGARRQGAGKDCSPGARQPRHERLCHR